MIVDGRHTFPQVVMAGRQEVIKADLLIHSATQSSSLRFSR
jgi:hypothetical protein